MGKSHLICKIDADDSDTDSEPAAMENGINEHQTVYAEVLYSFKAVGAEELSLERGALVEVLRIESGPWWWGQIKHDAILSGPQHEPRQGWFPRDFVKVRYLFQIVFLSELGLQKTFPLIYIFTYMLYVCLSNSFTAFLIVY